MHWQVLTNGIHSADATTRSTDQSQPCSVAVWCLHSLHPEPETLNTLKQRHSVALRLPKLFPSTHAPTNISTHVQKLASLERTPFVTSGHFGFSVTSALNVSNASACFPSTERARAWAARSRNPSVSSRESPGPLSPTAGSCRIAFTASSITPETKDSLLFDDRIRCSVDIATEISKVSVIISTST